MYLPSAKITVRDFCFGAWRARGHDYKIIKGLHRILQYSCTWCGAFAACFSLIYFFTFNFSAFCFFAWLLLCRVVVSFGAMFWFFGCAGSPFTVQFPCSHTNTNIDKCNDRRIAQKRRIAHTHPCIHAYSWAYTDAHVYAHAVCISIHMHTAHACICVLHCRLINRFVFHYLNV